MKSISDFIKKTVSQAKAGMVSGRKLLPTGTRIIFLLRKNFLLSRADIRTKHIGTARRSVRKQFSAGRARPRGLRLSSVEAQAQISRWEI